MLSGRPEDKVNIETTLPSRKIIIIIIFIFLFLINEKKVWLERRRTLKKPAIKQE